MPATTPRYATLYSKYANSIGLQDTVLSITLAIELGRAPTSQEIRERKSLIANSNLSTVANEKLISFGNIQMYYIGEKVDEIRRRRRFTIEFESQPEKDAMETGSVLDRRDEELLQARWGQISLADAIGHMRRGFDLDVQQTSLRESSITQSMTRKVSSLRKNGGAIFFLFGSSHADMVDVIGNNADPQRAFVRTKTTLASSSSELEVSALRLMREGKKPSDELFARLFFVKECFDAVSNLFYQSGGKLEDYANNFVNIREAISEVAASLSIDQIRDLNDTRTPVLTIFFGHPAARVVLPYLH